MSTDAVDQRLASLVEIVVAPGKQCAPRCACVREIVDIVLAHAEAQDILQALGLQVPNVSAVLNAQTGEHHHNVASRTGHALQDLPWCDISRHALQSGKKIQPDSLLQAVLDEFKARTQDGATE